MYSILIYQNEICYLEYAMNKSEVFLGKNPDSDLMLKGWNIGKVHAKLIYYGDDLFIEDLGSLFGTTVNGERVYSYGPITSLDIITIGSYSISIVKAVAETINLNSTVESISQPERSTNYALQYPTSKPVDLADLQKTSTNSVSDSLPNSIKTNSSRTTDLPNHNIVKSNIDRSSTIIKPVRNEIHLLSDKWRRICHEAVLAEMDAKRIDSNRLNDDALRANVGLIIQEVISSMPEIPKVLDLNELAVQILNEAVGLGPLDPLLNDDDVSEIMVNKFDEIWVEKGGQLSLSSVSFTSDVAVLGAIERIVTPLGRRIDESSPMVDARLKDGSRVNAIVAPLSIRGPSITIRKFSKKQIAASDFVSFNSLTDEMVELIRCIITMRLNVVISGGTGTGKTTFLNMIGNFIDQNERIVTIEDAAELKLMQPNLVSLESRPPNLEGKGVISIRDLVRNSLRMRPDRIIVGECRGGEALDMLQAMNTGHDGSMTTLHANSPRDALARMEVLVMMAGMNLPVRAIREQIASAVHVIIQLTRFSCGSRKVVSITEIVGIESESIQLQEIYRFSKTGIATDGKIIGQFIHSGLKPEFMKLAL